MKKSLFILLAFSAAQILSAQPWFKRFDSIPVSFSGTPVINPWTGGLNFCQFSQIDMNQDGIKDLFVFDRTGNRISTFINKGTANTVDYVSAPEYAGKFPVLVNWVLLADYNCDGKEDIFTSTPPNGGSITVYRNDSDVGNGLKFTKVTSKFLYSNYKPDTVNLYVTTVDIPSITDMDGDGDLDIVTMSILGTFFEYHQNMSVEHYGVCDSLNSYELASSCWGEFAENFSDNKVNLNQSCKMKSYTPDSTMNVMHSGSCELCLDIDSDGDKEIILGGISFSNMTLVVNGGSTASAKMTSQDSNFPTASTPVLLDVFPCAYYLDVDNDGLKDLIVSPNAGNASENFNSVWMYKNAASAANSFTPVFQKNNFLQDQMIDVGEGAYPVFFDYNGDNKMDLLVSNYKYYTQTGLQSKVAAFKNTGTATKPSFDLETRDYQNLSSLNIINMMPTFGDLDNDGDKDMLIGDNIGQLYYFTNTPSGGAANYTLTQSKVKDNASAVIDVGNYAAPQLIDVDRDGRLDLIIGCSSGTLTYYRNTGTISAPIFTKITNAFGGVNIVRKSTYSITGYSTPYMYDSGGKYKLLLGSESGYLYYYNNIDGNLAGKFNLVDSSYEKIGEGSRTAITGSDINNDGLLDLVIGNYAGGVSVFKGQTSDPQSVSPIEVGKLEFSLYPNPSSGTLNINLSNSQGVSQVAFIDMLGREIYSQQTARNFLTLDVSPFPQGMYTCRITVQGRGGEWVGARRFVKY